MNEIGIFIELESYLLEMKGRKDDLPYYNGLDGEKDVITAILNKVRKMKDVFEETLPTPEDIDFTDRVLGSSLEYNTDPEKGTVWTGEDRELTAAVRNLGVAVDDIRKTIRARMGMGVPKTGDVDLVPPPKEEKDNDQG